MTIAMLKQLMPMQVIPPSPKKSAWMIKATETEITAAQGPRTIAHRVPPTAWAVVPPGIGMLNIMIVKEKAAKIASSGTICPDIDRLSLRPAVYQNGAAAT